MIAISTVISILLRAVVVVVVVGMRRCQGGANRPTGAAASATVADLRPALVGRDATTQATISTERRAPTATTRLGSRAT